MMLLRGVSVQANGLRSTSPRSATATVSELIGDVASATIMSAIEWIICGSSIRFASRSLSVSEKLSLQDPRAEDGYQDFRKDHHDEDRDQHDGDQIPVKQVERGIERYTDAAGADDAEHGGFADVDVPAE